MSQHGSPSVPTSRSGAVARAGFGERQVLADRGISGQPLAGSGDAKTGFDLARHRLAPYDGHHPVEFGRRRGVTGCRPQPTAQRLMSHARYRPLQTETVGGIQGLGKAVEIGSDLASQIGRAVEQRDRVTIADVAEQGQHLVADTVSHEAGIGVRGIIDGFQTESSAQLHRFGSTESEDRMAKSRLHGGETVEPGAAHQVDQQGFGLIIGGVTGHGVGAEDAMAGLASPVLQVGAGFDVDGLGSKSGTESLGRRRHGVGFRCRTGAQAVIDVDGGDIQPRSTCEPQQRE